MYDRNVMSMLLILLGFFFCLGIMNKKSKLFVNNQQTNDQFMDFFYPSIHDKCIF